MPPPASQDASSKPLLLLADPITIPEFEQQLTASYRLLPAASANEAAAASARALLTIELPAVTAAQIDALPALQIVVASSADVDHIDLAACRRRRISVTTAGDAFSADCADYAVGLVVVLLRRVAAADAYVRRGSWEAAGNYPVARKVLGF
ncbi:hypothetical protein ABZP36_002842 [Zizania latifolia]